MSLSFNNEEQKNTSGYNVYGSDILLVPQEQNTEHHKDAIFIQSDNPKPTASDSNEASSFTQKIKDWAWSLFALISVFFVPYICVKCLDDWISDQANGVETSPIADIFIPSICGMLAITFIIYLWVNFLNKEVGRKFYIAVATISFISLALFCMQKPTEAEYMPIISVITLSFLATLIICSIGSFIKNN